MNARRNETRKPNNFSAAEATLAIRLSRFFSADFRLRHKIRRRRPNSAAQGSSREGCSEECRRQTISPPDPDATLRSMTSRSTVTQPVGREVVNERGVETPPASPVHQYRDALDIEHCRRRAVDVTLLPELEYLTALFQFNIRRQRRCYGMSMVAITTYDSVILIVMEEKEAKTVRVKTDTDEFVLHGRPCELSAFSYVAPNRYIPKERTYFNVEKKVSHIPDLVTGVNTDGTHRTVNIYSRSRLNEKVDVLSIFFASVGVEEQRCIIFHSCLDIAISDADVNTVCPP